MEKETQGFFAKIFGNKKKSGCCGVVVEEVDSKENSETPVTGQQPKCCQDTAKAEK